MSVAKIFAIRVRFAGIIWGLCAYLERTQLRQGLGLRLFRASFGGLCAYLVGTQLRQGLGLRLVRGYYLGFLRIFGGNTATPRIRTPSGSRVLFGVYAHIWREHSYAKD